MSLPLSDDLAVVPAVISFVYLPLSTEYLCLFVAVVNLLVGSILIHNRHLDSDVAVANTGVGTDNALL